MAAFDVIVDRFRNTDDRNFALTEVGSEVQGSGISEDHQGVQLEFFHYRVMWPVKSTGSAPALSGPKKRGT